MILIVDTHEVRLHNQSMQDPRASMVHDSPGHSSTIQPIRWKCPELGIETLLGKEISHF